MKIKDPRRQRQIEKLENIKGSMSVRKFSDFVGLSHTTIRRLLSGEQEFNMKIDQAITEVCERPAGYFLNEFIQTDRVIREQSQDYDAGGGYLVRVVGLIPAGNLEIYEQPDEMPSLRLPFKNCKGAIAVKVIGDSMENLYFEGDILILNERPADQAIKNGNTYVVEWENDDGKPDRAVKYVFKIAGGYRLRSKNGKHQDIVVKNIRKFYRIILEITKFRDQLA